MGPNIEWRRTGSVVAFRVVNQSEGPIIGPPERGVGYDDTQKKPTPKKWTLSVAPKGGAVCKDGDTPGEGSLPCWRPLALLA